MGWSYGELDRREVGYAVECTCDATGCEEVIDRGIDYRCGRGLDGCGRYLCYAHQTSSECEHEDMWDDAPDPGRVFARHLVDDQEG